MIITLTLIINCIYLIDDLYDSNATMKITLTLIMLFPMILQNNDVVYSKYVSDNVILFNDDNNLSSNEERWDRGYYLRDKVKSYKTWDLLMNWYSKT